MLTVSSIPADKGVDYARYLESKTVAPSRGDYYLSPAGEPTQAPGRWLAEPQTLARLGIQAQQVEGSDLVALMQGRGPATGAWIRAAGSTGVRAGGIDLTFSAPKSVSVVWALGTEKQRSDMLDAHMIAVTEAVNYLRRAVPTVRRHVGHEIVEEHSLDLLAAEFRHTTARGTLDGDVPDPQLHSHVVATAAVRSDGRIVAVASRPIFRAAREVGAYYRSALAHELRQRGYPVEAGTGRHQRYFEIAGVPRGLCEAFSARSREVARAAERFRAQWGREPRRHELRKLKLENRKAKSLVTTRDLEAAWHQVAARVTPEHQTVADRLDEAASSRRDGELADRAERQLTARAATFERRELNAVLLEQSVGELSPADALATGSTLLQSGRVLRLQAGHMTTRTVRLREEAIEDEFRRLAESRTQSPSTQHLNTAAATVAERVGRPLSDEQGVALAIIAGSGRAAVLIGPAGTGKGVVIDVAARAEQLAGREPLGVAVAGSTAQRLARDSPALAGRTLTVDALIARADSGRLIPDRSTTVYFDEAGMADSARLGPLVELIGRSGAKLVLVGDAAQLPSIGPGGMFERLSRVAPCAQLTTVHRTSDVREKRAWRDLRSGRSDKALAHYLARGRLHMSDTRDQAVELAVADWARLSETHPIHQLALISDASNVEIARINARAQHYRAAREELGDVEVAIPGVHYGVRRADRVTLIAQHYEPGTRRIENGSRGEVLDVLPDPGVVIRFDVTGEQRTLIGEDLKNLRLAYAQHIHRAQGATVARTLVVTGGWQMSKEASYVEASRAREGTDWYVNRLELGQEGHDVARIKRLAANMRRSRRQTPSLNLPRLEELDAPTLGRSLPIDEHLPEQQLPGVEPGGREGL